MKHVLQLLDLLILTKTLMLTLNPINPTNPILNPNPSSRSPAPPRVLYASHIILQRAITTILMLR